MNDQTELKALLESIDQSNRKQALYGKLQCVFCLAAAVCCLAVLLLGVKILPEVQDIALRADAILTDLESVTEELAHADLSGLEDVIDELAKADLSGMVAHIDELVNTSQSGVEDTMDKLNEINFEALNKTIEDLSQVVERLARVTKFLG